MADAVTLPADLYRPEVVEFYTGYEIYQSLEVLEGCVGVSPESPVRVIGLEKLIPQGREAYVERPVFKEIASLAARRDITSSADIDTLKLEGRNDNGVLCHRRLGPVAFTPDAAWLTRASQAEIEMELARQFSIAMRVDLQDAVIRALYGIIQGMTTTAHTYSVWNATDRANLSPSVLANALYKMAEFGKRISCWIMRSESLLDLTLQNIGQAFQGVADVVQRGGLPLMLGRTHCVVDHASLTATDVGFDKYYTIGVGPGMLDIEFSRPMKVFPLFTYVDKETVQHIIRADYDFTLIPHGAQWDKTNGGANPTVAALATATNWDPTYTSHKEIHGVIAEHNYSGN